MIIRCPWPDKELWPNGRPNHFAKARKTKFYRQACNTLAKEQSAHMMRWPEDRIDIHLTFHTKTARLPDDDNLEAAFKSGRDGIADAMGVDDATFRVTRSYGDPVKGGCIVVRVDTPAVASIPHRGTIS